MSVLHTDQGLATTLCQLRFSKTKALSAGSDIVITRGVRQQIGRRAASRRSFATLTLTRVVEYSTGTPVRRLVSLQQPVQAPDWFPRETVLHPARRGYTSHMGRIRRNSGSPPFRANGVWAISRTASSSFCLPKNLLCRSAEAPIGRRRGGPVRFFFRFDEAGSEYFPHFFFFLG